MVRNCVETAGLLEVCPAIPFLFGWSSFAAIFHCDFFHETPPAMSQVQGLVVLDTRTLLDREVVQIHTDTS